MPPRTHHPKVVLLAMVGAASLVFACTTSVTAAIPEIARGLRASQSEVQFIADAYPLVLGALVLPAGGLLDRYGRKRGMVAGLAVLAAGLAWSGLAGSPVELIASRVLAGAGSALLLPGTLATLTAVLPDEQRGRAIALWAGSLMAGGTGGLLVAGAAIELASWEASFLVVAGVALLVLVATALFIPETYDPEHASLDPLGALLACLGIGGVVLAIIELPTRSAADPVVVGGSVVGVLGLAAFVWWELRAPRPLLDLRLFADRSFCAGNVALVLIFGGAFGWFFLSFQYYAYVLDYGPFRAGLGLIPTAVSTIPLTVASTRLAARYGRGPVVVGGLAAMGAGAAIMAAVGTLEAFWPMAAGFFVFGIGIGLGSTPPTEAIIEALPRSRQGVASAVNDASREIGAAIGIAVLGSLFNAGYRAQVDDALDGTSAALVETVRSSPAAGAEAAGRGGAFDARVAQAVNDGFVAGWELTFVVAVAFFGLSAATIHRWAAWPRVELVAAPAPRRIPPLDLARIQAERLAHQTNGLLALVQYADGPQRWTVFVASQPIAAFPAFGGDLRGGLRFHDLERLELIAPASDPRVEGPATTRLPPG